MTRQQIDLQVGHRRARAHEVVADEAVEIEWRSCSRVDLHVAHFLLWQQGIGHLAGYGGGLLERTVLRHVEDDLELALVVEGQHFHLHETERNEGERPQEKDHNHREEGPPPLHVVDEVAHPFTVKQGELTFLFPLPVMLPDFARQHAAGRPRRDDERDEQRPEHRRARPDRDRTHVGTHQTADKSHRQNRRDDRERGKDRRVTHLGHRFDRNLAEIAADVLRHAVMPHHIFHHHDGVIDEDADGKNQREQRDAVQRVAVKIEHEQRQRQSRRNGNGHDDRFAPSQHEHDEQ